MNDVVILCAPDPTHRAAERAPAMAMIEALADHWPLTLWPVRDRTSYSRMLHYYWDDPRTIINVEHDMGITPEHVRALLSCPHDLCAWLYPMSPASTGQTATILSARPHRPGGRWALTAAPGLCKMSKDRRTGVFPVCPYPDVEFHVWTLCGGPWHVHYPPMAHYHGFRRSVYARWQTERSIDPDPAGAAV